MLTKRLAVLFLSSFLMLNSHAQKTDNKYTPLKLSLNETGSQYVRFLFWNQVWASHDMQQNGTSADDGLAFSIRRSRVMAYAQLSPRFLIMTHFGLNSLSGAGLSGNPNAQNNNQRSTLFLHGSWGELKVREKWYVGAGLHFWNGFSRLSNQSSITFMSMDNPGTGRGDATLFPWATITTSDQFARHLGVYAKGSIRKLNIRLSANNARPNKQVLESNATSMQVEGTSKDLLYTAYVNYQFIDKENTKLPYFVGTYMGKKKVFNVGAGIHHQPRAMKAGFVDSNGMEVFSTEENITFAAADIYYDAPLGKKGKAINLLGAYYNYNFGENAKYNQGGFVPGNGSIVFGQAGFYLPWGDKGIMPYASTSLQHFSATPNTSYELGIGCNYFISGHNAKLTAEYNTGRKGIVNAGVNSRLRLQLQVFL